MDVGGVGGAKPGPGRWALARQFGEHRNHPMQPVLRLNSYARLEEYDAVAYLNRGSRDESPFIRPAVDRALSSNRSNKPLRDAFSSVFSQFAPALEPALLSDA